MNRQLHVSRLVTRIVRFNIKSAVIILFTHSHRRYCFRSYLHLMGINTAVDRPKHIIVK